MSQTVTPYTESIRTTVPGGAGKGDEEDHAQDIVGRVPRKETTAGPVAGQGQRAKKQYIKLTFVAFDIIKTEPQERRPLAAETPQAVQMDTGPVETLVQEQPPHADETPHCYINDGPVECLAQSADNQTIGLRFVTSDVIKVDPEEQPQPAAETQQGQTTNNDVVDQATGVGVDRISLQYVVSDEAFLHDASTSDVSFGARLSALSASDEMNRDGIEATKRQQKYVAAHQHHQQPCYDPEPARQHVTGDPGLLWLESKVIEARRQQPSLRVLQWYNPERYPQNCSTIKLQSDYIGLGVSLKGMDRPGAGDVPVGVQQRKASAQKPDEGRQVQKGQDTSLPHGATGLSGHVRWAWQEHGGHPCPPTDGGCTEKHAGDYGLEQTELQELEVEGGRQGRMQRSQAPQQLCQDAEAVRQLVRDEVDELEYDPRRDPDVIYISSSDDDVGQRAIEKQTFVEGPREQTGDTKGKSVMVIPQGATSTQASGGQHLPRAEGVTAPPPCRKRSSPSPILQGIDPLGLRLWVVKCGDQWGYFDFEQHQCKKSKVAKPFLPVTAQPSLSPSQNFLGSMRSCWLTGAQFEKYGGKSTSRRWRSSVKFVAMCTDDQRSPAPPPLEPFIEGRSLQSIMQYFEDPR